MAGCNESKTRFYYAVQCTLWLKSNMILKSLLQKKIDDECVNKYLYTSLIEWYLSNNQWSTYIDSMAIRKMEIVSWSESVFAFRCYAQVGHELLRWQPLILRSVTRYNYLTLKEIILNTFISEIWSCIPEFTCRNKPFMITISWNVSLY